MWIPQLVCTSCNSAVNQHVEGSAFCEHRTHKKCISKTDQKQNLSIQQTHLVGISYVLQEQTRNKKTEHTINKSRAHILCSFKFKKNKELKKSNLARPWLLFKPTCQCTSLGTEM